MTRIHRQNKKIVHNHSSLVPGLKDAMKEISNWPEVDSVVPGHMTRGGRTPGFQITVQRDTISGLRCIAKHGSGNQELYITTSRQTTVRHRMAEMGWK